MTLITDLAKSKLGQSLLAMEPVITDRVNRVFTDTTDDLISDLTYQELEGDTSREYREFMDRFVRSKSHDYAGSADLDFPDVEEFEKEGRFAPWQKVIPGGKWDLNRVERRPLPEIGRMMQEVADAVVFEAAQIRIDKFTDMILSGNAGMGGISPLSGGSGSTLYNPTIRQLRAPEKAPFSNINDTISVSSLTDPTIADAHKLAQDAELYFAAADTNDRYGFTDPETVRDGLYWVTTNNAWYKAFRDLQSRPTLATNTADPADNASNYGNDYQNRIQVRFAKGHTGAAYAPWVRCFYRGPRPDDRPALMAPDLGARAYQLGRDGFNLTMGFLLSWYTVAWKPETARLYKPVAA